MADETNDGQARASEDDIQVVVDLSERPEINSDDSIDPVEILSKLPKDFYDNLASSKWKDRKEALDSLLAISKQPKIQDDRYHELVSTIGKKFADPNVVVVVVAAGCIENLARGLRSDFSPYRNMVRAPF